MLHQTKVLLDQADALERAGHWQSVISLCEEIFRLSVVERNLENLLEALLRTGFAYEDIGERELATEYLELTCTIAELTGDNGIAGRALNGLAILHQEHGDVAAAAELYRRAREFATSAGDTFTTGSIDQNLGTLANIRGDLTEALQFYRSGLDSYEQIQHQRGISNVLNNLGMLYIDLHQLDVAGKCLERALEVSRAIGDVVTESIVQINRTELFLERGQPELARSTCDEAFEITSRLNEVSCKAEVLKFYGIIYRQTNKIHLAESHLRQAAELAIKHSYPLQEADAQRELALVLRAQGRNREALEALNRAHALFSSLNARHDQADINKRFSQLEADFLTLVRLWGESIEAKDRYTRGHCQRVADYACCIAERAGITEREMVWFRMGAFLHDVGKTEVPAEILNKPGKLTDEERAIIEQHTVIGDEMLSSIEFPWDIRPMVRWHHERWDGGGYPDGLAGEQIPVPARIMRLADIFDALTTTRSYRQPMSPEAALQIMRDDRGSFDPELFEIFCELFPRFSGMVGGEDSARNGEEESVLNSENAA